LPPRTPATLAAALLLAGCTTVLQPPADPSDPQPAFLLDHGRHATLVLPRPEGGLVRYAYGDWAYYGRNRTGVLRGMAALLWPTPAALARRELAGPASRAGVRRAVQVGIEAIHVLPVAGDRARALRQRLDARFAEYGDSRRDNPWYDLTFVRLPERYWMFSNSNQRTAAWLGELGVEVRGAALWSRWRVEGL
jgi:hypothetical protein